MVHIYIIWVLSIYYRYKTFISDMHIKKCVVYICDLCLRLVIQVMAKEFIL